jgi:hypothetical protein
MTNGEGIGRCLEGAKCYTRGVALFVVAFTLLIIMPAASSSPPYSYVITPTPDASARSGSPIIRRVELNKQHFSSHDQIRMKVITSGNVVKVTNHEIGHGGTLRKLSAGVFFGTGRVSGVPFFLKGMQVDMHYTATTANGETTTVTAPVTF